LSGDFPRPPEYNEQEVNSLTPSKEDRIHPILFAVIAIMIVVPAALTWIFLFGKLYGAVAFVAMLLLLGFLTRFFRRRKRTHPEMMSRIEEALSGGEPSKDPRQMARWMR